MADEPSRQAALGLGGNVGDVAAAFVRALGRLGGTPGVRLARVSSVYRTPPWGKLDQPPFLNMAAIVETTLPARALLALCLEIERGSRPRAPRALGAAHARYRHPDLRRRAHRRAGPEGSPSAHRPSAPSFSRRWPRSRRACKSPAGRSRNGWRSAIAPASRSTPRRAPGCAGRSGPAKARPRGAGRRAERRDGRRARFGGSPRQAPVAFRQVLSSFVKRCQVLSSLVAGSSRASPRRDCGKSRR